MKSLKILVSAYACRPGEGSEPGVGWNSIRELIKYHQVWVLTRSNNRPALKAELKEHPQPNLQVIYCDVPQWINRLNQNQRLVYLHYYIWQIEAYFLGRKLLQEIPFDFIHHITYVRHSSPSFLALLPVPFIWGPVGGGESAPAAFWQDFSWKNRVYEILRETARFVGEIDPFVGLTARRSILARGTTEDTAQRLRLLGAKNVQVYSQLGLSSQEIQQLNQQIEIPRSTIRWISIGRLLHWKGFHLGLRAFARAKLPSEAEYWIIGEGPEKNNLQALANHLGIESQVKFFNKLSREETLEKLGSCLALVHPSLHESGGLVCLEAMAAGCPVLCLDLGGPGIQVTAETGFKIAPNSPEQVVQDLAEKMNLLASNSDLWQKLSQGGVQRVKDYFSWEKKGLAYGKLYEELKTLEVES